MSVNARPSVPVVSVSQGYSCFCKLPARYAQQLHNLRQPVVIRLLLDEVNAGEGPEELLVTWHGAVSNQHPDCVEISWAFFNKMSASMTNAPANITTSCIYYILHIASEVVAINRIELVPHSAHDWHLVCANAEVVEEVLLRQTCVVQLGSHLHVALPSSAMATMRVEGMQTGRAAVEDGHTVGTLTASTEVCVAPVRDAGVRGTAVDEDADVNRCSSIDGGDAEETVHHFEEGVVAVCDVARSLAPQLTLRMLPQSIRGTQALIPTNYQHALVTRTSAEGMLNSEEGQTGQAHHDLWDADPSHVPTEHDQAEDGICTQEVVYDKVSAYVHPSFFDALLGDAIAALLRGNPSQISSTEGGPLVEQDVVAVIRRHTARILRAAKCALLRKGYVLILLRSSSVLGGRADPPAPETPLTPTLTVKMSAHWDVRPYHISLPMHSRAALGWSSTSNLGANICKWDFSSISVEILPWNSKKRARPFRVAVHPLVKMGQSQDLSIGAAEELNLPELKMAMLRWRETEARGDAVLAHGQIIELNTVRSRSAYIVNLHADRVEPNREPGLYSELFDGEAPVHYYALPEQSAAQEREDGAFMLLCEELEDPLVELLETLRWGQSYSVSDTTSIPICDVNADFHPKNTHSDARSIIQGRFSQRPYGTKVALNTALESFLPLLLPEAVHDRAHFMNDSKDAGRDARPPVGTLLIGPSGCGSTTVCKHLCHLLGSHRSILAHAEYVDCVSLCAKFRSKPLASLLNAIESHVNNAVAKAPSILVLDRLDVLTPTTRCGASKSAVEYSAGGGTYSERAGILSLHMERLLTRLHDACHNSFESLAHSLRSRGKHGGIDAVNAVHAALRSTVSVLAVATDLEQVSPRLTQSSLFNPPIALPRSPNPPARLQIIRDFLEQQGFASEAMLSGEISPQELAEFRDLSSGMCVSDLIAAAQFAAATSAARSFSCDRNEGSSSMHGTCDFGDVIWALKDSATETDSLPVSPWSAVGGLKKAKKQILHLFRSPVLYKKLYAQMGSRAPKAMLLYGPPGCGKTMLAKASAKKCGLRSVSVAGPQLLNKYIGASERAVRALFDEARDSGKSTLIFFDEFEALVPKRGQDNTGVTDRVVNQFLTFLDGVEDTMGQVGNASKLKRLAAKSSAKEEEKGKEGEEEEENEDEEEDEEEENDEEETPKIYIIAATSRPDLIDPAILRPGRVEVHTFLGPPTAKERERILRMALSPLRTVDAVSDAMTVNEAIFAVATARSADELNSSDLHSIASTAFLMATNDHIANSTAYDDEDLIEEHKPLYEEGQKAAKPRANEVQVAVSGRHIWGAFKQTRPSLSAKDREFYREIHEQFQRKDKNAAQGDTISPANTSASATVHDNSGPPRIPAAEATPPRVLGHGSGDANPTVSPLRPYIPGLRGRIGSSPFMAHLPPLALPSNPDQVDDRHVQLQAPYTSSSSSTGSASAEVFQSSPASRLPPSSRSQNQRSTFM